MADDPHRGAEVAHNAELWALVNAEYADALADRQWRATGVRWGLFATPEESLGALDDVAGRDVVELACGTAAFGASLVRAGARVVGVDLSWPQLATARRLQQRLGPRFPLVQADAERIPLADGCCDLVVSEHGVAAWCDPQRWVAEAARLLRPGGRLAFLTNSLLSALTVPAEGGPAGDRLLRPQRAVSHLRWPGGGWEFHPSHGDWVRVLRRHGFVVDALLEVYGHGAHDDVPYDIVTPEWAVHWPAEELWVARKAT